MTEKVREAKVARHALLGQLLLVIFLMLSLPSSSAEADSSIRSLLESSRPLKTTATVETTHISRRGDLKRKGRAESSRKHELVIARKQRNIEKIKQILHDVSNPQSANYGHFLTKREIVEMTSDSASENHLLRYLELNGVRIKNSSKNKEYFTVEASVATWENIFSAEFFEFEHSSKISKRLTKDEKEEDEEEEGGVSIIRALQYSLPDALADHVSAVFNLVNYPSSRTSSRTSSSSALKRTDRSTTRRISMAGLNNNIQLTSSSSPSSTTTTITSEPQNTNTGDDDFSSSEWYPNVYPALLNAVYNIENNNGSYATQSVFETKGQSFSPSDLHTFQETFGLPLNPLSGDVIGGHNHDKSCVADVASCADGNLNVQYIMAVAQEAQTSYYYSDDWMLEFVTNIVNMDEPPLVYSINIVSPESEMTSSMLHQFDTEAVKLGALGVTLVAASGEDGAAGINARDNPLFCQYSPMMPASSPYVTAVGATRGLEGGRTEEEEEVVCQSDDRQGAITSGGGFSRTWARPAFQSQHVANYIAAVNKLEEGEEQKPVAGYNEGGRGYPDVALLGNSYLSVVSGAVFQQWGTAASAPVFAGMVSLVNSARIAEGKSPVGWINPVLYGYSEAIVLNDIVSGNNKCQAGYDAQTCCTQGYYARKGWDPVSGLGSIDFSALKSVLMSLGDVPFTPSMQPTSTSAGSERSPSTQPTESPTTAPSPLRSTTTGLVLESFFENENCEGDAFEISGVATATCFVQYNEQKQAHGSIKYTCDSEKLYITQYSDTACSAEFIVDEKEALQQCSPKMHNYYYGSFSMSCLSEQPDLSASMFNIPYVVEKRFVESADSDCTAQWVSYVGYSLGSHCYTGSDLGGGDTTSYMYTGLGNVSHYDNANCEGIPAWINNVAVECEAIHYSDDIYADDGMRSGEHGSATMEKRWELLGDSSSGTSGGGTTVTEPNSGIGVGMQFLIIVVTIGGAVILYKAYQKYAAREMDRNQHLRLSDNSASGVSLNPMVQCADEEEEGGGDGEENDGNGGGVIHFR